MLTGVRTIELRAAEWLEFDLDKAIWEVPTTRMKMRRPHLVPLSEQALELLRQLHEITGRFKLAFPGRNDSLKPMSEANINQVIKRVSIMAERPITVSGTLWLGKMMLRMLKETKKIR